MKKITLIITGSIITLLLCGMKANPTLAENYLQDSHASIYHTSSFTMRP